MKTRKVKWLRMGMFLTTWGPELMLICPVKVSARMETNRQQRQKADKSMSLACVLELKSDLYYLARLIQHQN